jgi:hypothetical protein
LKRQPISNVRRREMPLYDDASLIVCSLIRRLQMGKTFATGTGKGTPEAFLRLISHKCLREELKNVIPMARSLSNKP